MLRTIRKRLQRWSFLLFMTYLVLIVVFLFLESRLVFMPSFDEMEWQTPEAGREYDASFPSCDGNTITRTVDSAPDTRSGRSADDQRQRRQPHASRAARWQPA